MIKRKFKLSLTVDDYTRLRKQGVKWNDIARMYGVSNSVPWTHAHRIGYVEDPSITRYKRQKTTWEQRRSEKVPCNNCSKPRLKRAPTGLCQSCSGKRFSIKNLPGFQSSILQKTGKESKNWKGEDAGYDSKHKWISRHYGKEKRCEICETTDQNKRYEWANISGEYHREREDFKRLCKSCHTKFDHERGPATKHLEEINRGLKSFKRKTSR